EGCLFVLANARSGGRRGPGGGAPGRLLQSPGRHRPGEPRPGLPPGPRTGHPRPGVSGSRRREGRPRGQEAPRERGFRGFWRGGGGPERRRRGPEARGGAADGGIGTQDLRGRLQGGPLLCPWRRGRPAHPRRLRQGRRAPEHPLFRPGRGHPLRGRRARRRQRYEPGGPGRGAGTGGHPGLEEARPDHRPGGLDPRARLRLRGGLDPRSGPARPPRRAHPPRLHEGERHPQQGI
ncbi:MAG: hypothetical protein AVDCRST_MAG05-173, partial [uncultured Rubrobacteraceae bacterium]